MYDFGRTWSHEEYGSKERSLREIRRDMHKQREWRVELERMKISSVVSGGGAHEDLQQGMLCQDMDSRI